MPRCAEIEPELKLLDTERLGACHLYDEDLVTARSA
jgi:hypothetical protein